MDALRLAFLTLLASAGLAIGHGPAVTISGVKIVEAEGDGFLQIQVDPPTGGSRLSAAKSFNSNGRTLRRNRR